MPIDYEAEYNNRARVPEHPEIFAHWAREAEDYRAEAMKERRAELGLSYGSSLRQFIDLFSARRAVTAPLALFIHGGYWRSLDPSLFSHMARGLNAHDVTVAVDEGGLVGQNRSIAGNSGHRGAQTRYEAVPGTNHFAVIDALAVPQSAMVGRLAELARR